MNALDRKRCGHPANHAICAATLIAAAAALLSVAPANAQRNRSGGSAGGGNNNRAQPAPRSNPAPQPRSNPAPQPRSNPAPVMHARREEVRVSSPVRTPATPPRQNAPVTPLTPRRDQNAGSTGRTNPSVTPLTPRRNQNDGQVRNNGSIGTGSTPNIRRNPPARNSGARPGMSARNGGAAGAPHNVGKLKVRTSPVILAHRTFTKTTEGRHYDNGLLLRKGQKVTADWQKHYFPRGTFHYPYYRSKLTTKTCLSPFGFYFGICAPYISRAHCLHAPPVAVYIDIPLYNGDVCTGYAKIPPDDNLLDEAALDQREPGLANAVDELREAFGNSNIDALVTLVDPNSQIAVFERGQYAYSLSAADYLDMTRDALRATPTVEFDITRVHRRGDGVYVVSGKHLYTGEDGTTRKVYVSYVLQNINGIWTLTQVGTAPDKIQYL